MDSRARILADPREFRYVPAGDEDPRIQVRRQMQATELRMIIAQWINDPSVSDLDFAFWLHRYTYEAARDLVRYAMEIEGRQI